MQSIQIKVTGELGQSGFPFFVKQFAMLNKIKGFVKQSDDTLIIIEAEGQESDLNKFIKYCRIGPNGSIINSINITPSTNGKYRSFEIIEN